MSGTFYKQVVLGVGVSAVDYERCIAAVRDWIENRTGGEHRARYICVTSVHGIMTARKDSRFQSILNDADLVTPDGMPIVWAMRSFGVAKQQRVYGPDLFLALCDQSARLGHRLFLYGATEKTLSDLSSNLRVRFPKLNIAGTYAPPFRPLTLEEDKACIDLIRGTKADLIFVGLSTPKQECWMDGHLKSLPGAVMIGVGAAFDFHAGNVRQAPSIVQRAGLEWLFRLLMEPKRLWRRYILITPKFLPLWALQRLGAIRYETKDLKSPSSVLADERKLKLRRTE